MRPRTMVRALLVAGLAASVAVAGGPSVSATPSAAAPSRGVPTPVLIERAVESGALDRDLGYLYLAYALSDWSRVPAEYRSDVPFHGTVWLLELREALERMQPGTLRSQIEAVLNGPGDIGTSACELSPLPNTDVLETDHFRIEYNALEVNNSPDGLTIQDYAESLEHSWQMQIDAFAWAEPPVYTPNPVPNDKYLVKVSHITPVIYGYVSNFGTHAGEVGDNPHTSWDDQDADASCMGLNDDYSLFPGTPRRALDATTAHEFNHSIQFGIGGLSGPNRPDSVFVEGGATWMEDEAYDSSNDNYNYLWPDFDDDMGDYGGSPYPYWITFRGLTERFGSSVPGGGEDIMQDFWEITSRNEGSNLEALDMALQNVGTNLAHAYQIYAVTVKFNKPCRGGYRRPYCFEEGPKYVQGDGTQQGAGQTEAHGQIHNVGGSHSGSVPDNYALNWVRLPVGNQRYGVFFENTSEGGAFRVALVCDTGTELIVRSMRVGRIEAGETGRKRVDPAGCDRIVAVITNVAQTEPDPEDSQQRSYTLRTQLLG